MITEERYRIILDELKAKKIITIQECAEITGTSESTARRDIITLDEMGKLKRVHGGATVLDHEYVSDEASVSEREQQSVDEKRAIGKYAVNMINDDDFIFVDAGTSTGWLIEYIENTKATIVTNGIAHAKKLIAKGIKTYILGGLVKAGTEAVIGGETVNGMKKFNFTKCFLGTNGIHPEYGFSTVDVEEALVKQEAVNRSYAAVVLADHSKFDKVTAVTFADIKRACIITDRLANDRYVDLTIIKEVLK